MTLWGRAETKERLQQVVCYRGLHVPEGLDLEERGRGEELLLAYLLPWPAWPVGSQGLPAPSCTNPVLYEKTARRPPRLIA